MLTITPEASDAIREILDATGAPEGSMFRISPQGQNGTGPTSGLAITLTTSPPPEDEIVQGDDVAVSVEPNAAQLLDDKKLDADVIGDQVNFSIGEQTPE